jgi:hypothetical protein
MIVFISCNNGGLSMVQMKEKQITFSDKTHALDNNDNFSPDGRYLCYDTRGTVYNNNLANCKSVETVEITTGIETVLWNPESVTGENGAPGIGAVSWHPIENKVVMIHGPLLSEVKNRGYYGIRNRNGVEVDALGKGETNYLDLRDVNSKESTIPGAHRGGTHRHEYSRNGKRVGFTYDDFLLPEYDRTIGFMEQNDKAPGDVSHYFAVLLKPVRKGFSKPGEIEKAYGDSWITYEGTKRAFIGVVRAENGVDYDTSLFVANIPSGIDITSAYSGDSKSYPEPPKGVTIQRLTYDTWVGGIVRGSLDGKQIAFLKRDKNDIEQLFVISTDVSEEIGSNKLSSRQVSFVKEGVSSFRWHPSGNWIFSISKGNILVTYVGAGEKFGQSVYLTDNEKRRSQLVISPDGNMLAYDIPVFSELKAREFEQVFVMNLDWNVINEFIEK